MKHFGRDFGFVSRIARDRFHNIYGPQGTLRGGREKAPAAFCRKIAANTVKFEMWGDGMQTRSFTYIDDCVEGIMRLFNSECTEVLNLGSDEMVSMNDMAKTIMEIGEKTLEIEHIPGPEGVRGRNSDNDMIKECLGWAPGILLKDGLTLTYKWINKQLDVERANGVDVEVCYGTSKVVAQDMSCDDQQGMNVRVDSLPAATTNEPLEAARRCSVDLRMALEAAETAKSADSSKTLDARSSSPSKLKWGKGFLL